MRRISQLAFMVFYVASSYAVSQERVRLITSEIQHASSKNAGAKLETCTNPFLDTFPSYRQAKPKANCDAYFGPSESVHLLPYESDPLFLAQTFSLKSPKSIGRLLSRAPPLHS